MTKSPNVRSIGDIHPRVRSQSTVDLLDAMRERADAGELVGVLVLSINAKGVWRHDRDAFVSDFPTLLGYLEMLKINLTHRFLTGESLTPDVPPMRKE